MCVLFLSFGLFRLSKLWCVPCGFLVAIEDRNYASQYSCGILGVQMTVLFCNSTDSCPKKLLKKEISWAIHTNITSN